MLQAALKAVNGVARARAPAPLARTILALWTERARHALPQTVVEDLVLGDLQLDRLLGLALVSLKQLGKRRLDLVVRRVLGDAEQPEGGDQLLGRLLDAAAGAAAKLHDGSDRRGCEGHRLPHERRPAAERAGERADEPDN
jgi:hypothetical protein